MNSVPSDRTESQALSIPPKVEEQYHSLEKAVKAGVPSANLEHIRAAFEYAFRAHGDQKRKSGEPYIIHPLAAAEIVAELGLDEESVIAALLHDCIEDTGATHLEIAHLFGNDVADIVEGVTKLTRVTYTSKEEEQMENFRKMLLAMASDIRVIIIKLADRLHNMRTLEYHTEQKQREKALETMEIYAPIAHRLGMQRLKWELEDLSIRYLDPIGYAAIAQELDKRKDQRTAFFETVQSRITERLAANGITCQVYGRIKHIYSIYRKMYSQNKSFEEVLDLYAFRVIVDSISDCYNVLGYIHEMYRPIPGHFKDYIGTPKPNMYQSLHTTVLGTEGIPFEVQIRTWEMHQTAEYGIAAHWKYKQGISTVGDEEKFAWIRRLLETQQESDAADFFKSLRTDMFSDEVFVFTPQGDVISLPAGSTPIDFAYNIHSAVGNSMTGAKVNSRIVPFTQILQDGDIVEVITSKSSKGPSRDWLKIVRSSEARNKIRQWFKREQREENIVLGREMFEAELKRQMLPTALVFSEEMLPRILKKLAYLSLDDLYAAIGYGGASAQKSVNKIRDEVRAAEKARKKEEPAPQTAPAAKPKPRSHPVNGVVVEGLDNCLVKFSRCCSPVPGDDIIGFITRGFGVSVHRKDCVNYLQSLNKPEEADRWIGVEWANNDSDTYTTTLHITAKERGGLVVDIASVVSAAKIRMTSFSARDIGDGLSTASVTLEVRNSTELTAVIHRISAVSGVTEVRRSDR